MRYTLKDYQVEAVRDVLENLEQAKDMYERHAARSQFSLSAATGAGKTVMAAAIIEALFFGADEFDFPADPGAVVLWFSDDPSLNEQSRFRIQSASPELTNRMRTIEFPFAKEMLEPGNIYFLNTQKLSRNSKLVRAERDFEGYEDGIFDAPPDLLQSSIYDIIANTINDDFCTLYLILDEAHRGMRPAKDRQTIVLRLINGRGTTPSIPIVMGISATVERFEDAMKGVEKRVALPSVEVDPALVQASGLLKDDIVLSIPAESGVFDTVLLTRAVEKVKASSKAWAKYAQSQGHAEAVKPLLVVQMGDKPTDEDLARTIDTIHREWPELPPDAIANVFGEHKDLHVGGIEIPYIEPQNVQDATWCRVLLAKTAISTGWDCPRAEVLMSFRPASDPTHITQLLGRMIRTPLARRIPGDEVLNSVDCLLPFFDTKTAKNVADMLMSGATGKESDTGGGKGRRVLFNPVELLPREDLPSEVWDKFSRLPSSTIPRPQTKPIRRLTALATALAKDNLREEAVSETFSRLCKALDGRAIEYADEVQLAREDVESMSGKELRKRLGTKGWESTGFTVPIDHRALQDSYRAAERSLSPALANAYVDHLAPNDEDLFEAQVRVAALGLVPSLVSDIEQVADNLSRQWLAETRVDRKNLPDEKQAEYDRLEGMSLRPERVDLTVPVTSQADTKAREADGTETPLPRDDTHLLVDDQGAFPLELNDWERKVLKTEKEQSGFLGWYRNPDRGVKESLAIAYKDADTWKALRPDFLFFSQVDGEVVVDLVDPHGFHLADALPKLRGLAKFAEAYGEEFRRIEAVALVGDQLRVLDLTRPVVREEVQQSTNAQALYESNYASDYQ